ncbi:MAG: alpha-L-arabinofuranosidase C-terminal domain-containing protein [Rufibacter sp.]
MERREFVKLSAGLAVTSLVSPSFVFRPEEYAEASVLVHPKREIGRVDKKVYGHFLEHVENVVYKGIFDPKSPLSDEMGLRLDVIQAIKDMGGAHTLRWPGGNFVSYYHWKDGIGPREKRPEKFSVVWSEMESNQFGTDEYLALCKKLDCEPFITANMGNGTIEEACEWVAYCKNKKDMPPVQIWGLGNEHFGPWQVGHYTAEEYGRKAQQFGLFMRNVDPTIKYVGVGFTEPEWNETVLKHSGEYMDWMTIHLYGHRNFLEGKDDFDQLVATPHFFEKEIKEIEGTLEAYEKNSKRKEPIQICLEEWNDRHLNKEKLLRNSPRNIVDALFVAGVFNACLRNAARVTMTNYVFLLNAHAPIVVLENGILKSATFDVYRLFSTVMQQVAVKADVKCNTFTATLSQSPGYRIEPPTVTAPRLDVSATVSPDGKKLVLSLLNLEKSKPVRVKLDIAGQRLAKGGTLHTLYTKDMTAINTVQNPNTVRSVSKTLKGTIDSIELLPHSVNFLELSLEA